MRKKISFNYLLILGLILIICYIIYSPKQSDELEEIFKINKISVVIPFHIKQLDKLIQNIKSWELYKPCSKIPSVTSENIALFFYVGYLNESVEISFNKFISKSFDCFSKVNIIKYKYEEAKFDKHVLGSRLMFEYMLLKNDSLFQELDYVFYMEPDTRPIRSNWLNCLLDQVLNQNIWVKGSLYRGNTKLIIRTYLPYFFHINGNAIYRIGDRKFKDFYFNKLRTYVVKKHGDSLNAYDTDFYEYLLDIDNYEITKDVFHKFQMSSFVQNYWNTEYNLTEFRLNNPDTFFVHGGHQI